MHSSAKILIVDDDPDLLLTTSHLLGKHGYQVIRAATGKDALNLASKYTPDLVLLDVGLPDINGLQVCKRLKAKPDLVHTFVVIFSASRTNSTEQALGLEEGADGYIVRPISNRELVARIQTMLRLKQAQEESRKHLRELEARTKELDCLYGLSELVRTSDGAFDTILHGAVHLLPPAWQHPEMACARIVFAEREFTTENFQETPWVQTSDIVVQGKPSGTLEVRYLKDQSQDIEPAFTPEEQRLLDTFAERLGRSIERMHRESELARYREHSWARRVEELNTLDALGRQVNASLSLDQVVDAALNETFNSIHPDVTVLYLCQEDALHLAGMRINGPDMDYDGAQVTQIGDCLCGLAAQTGQPLYSQNIHTDPRCTLNECKNAGLQTFAALPLLQGNKTLGILGIAFLVERDLEERSPFLEALTGEIALGLGNALLHQQIKLQVVELEGQIYERERAEKELERHQQQLEELVRQRTAELTFVNQQLRQEITERARIEAALSESESRYRQLIETLQEGVWAIDHNAYTTFVNPSMARMLGYTSDEMQGRHVLELIDQSIQEAIGHNLLHRTKGGQGQYDLALLRKDGSRLNTTVAVAPLTNERGEYAGAIAGVQDMTERIEMEEALRERKELLQAIIESQDEGVSIVDPNERFTFVNPAAEKIFGVPPGTLIGRQITEFTDPKNTQLIRTQTQQRSQGLKHTYQYDITRLDGEKRRLLITSMPQFDDAKQFTGSFGVFRDVTERVRMEKELQEAHQNLERRVQMRTAELAQANQTLQQRNRELELLNRAAQVFTSILDLDQVLTTILEQVRHLMDASACSIWLLDAESGELVCEQASGFGNDQIKGWCLPVGEGITGWVIEHGKYLYVPDTRFDDRHFKEIDQRSGLELRSILAVPLQVKSITIGVLEVLDQAPARFTETDRTLLELIAASAATAIENAQLYRSLDRARRQWEEIFQAIGHPTVILDSEYNILDANRAMIELSQESLKSLLGKKCYEIFHGTNEHAPGCPVSELLRSGHHQTVEMEMQTVGGVFLVSCTPIYDERQQLQQIIHIATDISDLKQAEKRLEESQFELENRNQVLVMTNAISATINQSLTLKQMTQDVLAKMLELTSTNAGWIALLNPDKQTFLVVAHQGISDQIIGQLEQVPIDSKWIDTASLIEWPQVFGETWTRLVLDTQALKAEQPFTLLAIPIQAREQFLGVFGVLDHRPSQLTPYEKDLFVAIGRQVGIAIENIQLLEDAAQIQLLREIDRLRSELIANASHELRTPLGLIKIFASALLMEEVEFSKEKTHEFLTAIEDETIKLEAIVDNLLDLGRMESGRLRLEKRPTELASLIQRTAMAMKPSMAGHQLVVELPQTPLTANIDAKRIEQVLRNLISNAIKYSPQGGTITVRAGKSKNQYYFSVSDQGIGIPEEEYSKIFERFYRVNNEVTSRVRGAGLGLPICRWLVQAHGGHIELESTPDVGSTFHVTLPSEGQ